MPRRHCCANTREVFSIHHGGKATEFASRTPIEQLTKASLKRDQHMRIVRYSQLDTSGVTSSVEKVTAALAEGDFRAAQVKKLKGTPFYRAKLNEKDRLLFRFGSVRGERVLLIYEVIRNHDYQKSPFLREYTNRGTGAAPLEESDFVDLTSLPNDEQVSLRDIPESCREFHFLDKVLTFDSDQEEVLYYPLPLILIGSAGSGKTAVSLQKIKMLKGATLYVSLSPLLVRNAEAIIRATHSSYGSEENDFTFYTFREFLESIQIPSGREVTYRVFREWVASSRRGLRRGEARRLFEEFRGVLTGQSDESPYLSRSEYLSLGVKQSIYLPEERALVYDIFEQYLRWMTQSSYFDTSILASEYASLVSPTYDSVVVDEVQDFTAAELALLLRSVKSRSQFLLCGDAHQIVHPNFFSWARLKSFFVDRQKDVSFSSSGKTSTEVIRILRSNFRNATSITSLANRVLLMKQARFGSIDKESAYLSHPTTGESGSVRAFSLASSNLQKLASVSARSARTAVLVLNDEDKVEARQHFATPLLFSVTEAKGLEYDTVVLFNIIGAATQEFREIAEAINLSDIEQAQKDGEIRYMRLADKTDKSLERLKFFINAFYVGLTRGIKHLIIVDNDTEHAFFRLLNVYVDERLDSTDSVESTTEEWAREAARLEIQGKIEQAEEIRTKLLGSRPAPWKVPTFETVHELSKDAISGKSPSRKAQRSLLTIATAHRMTSVLHALKKSGYGLASDRKGSEDYLLKSEYQDFVHMRPSQAVQLIQEFGPHVRTTTGETPLMVAARLGREDLARTFLEVGVPLSARNLVGLDAVGVLVDLLIDKELKLPSRQVQALTSTLAVLLPSSIKLRMVDKLVSLAQGSGEYALFILLRVLFIQEFGRSLYYGVPIQGVSLEKIRESVQSLPPSLLHPDKKTTRYIDGVLRRHEQVSSYPWTRRCFQRMKRGFYAPVINHQVSHNQRATSDPEWESFIDTLGLEELSSIDVNLDLKETNWELIEGDTSQTFEVRNAARIVTHLRMLASPPKSVTSELIHSDDTP
jgi:AAA domain